MKICLINQSDIPRSDVFDLGYYLRKNGHEITILYPTNGKILNSRGGIKTIPFSAYFLPKIHYAIPNLRKEYRIISKLVKDEKYEIIQACDYDYLTALPPIFVKRKTNTPIVLSTDAFPGVSWFFGNSFVDTTAKIYTRTLGKFIIDSYDELVVLSNKITEDAISLGVDKEKIHVIPIGVDFEQFNPHADGSDLKSELHIRDDEKVLLFIGRLSLVKRIDILIDLTKRLLKEGFKIKTIIVGDGEYKNYYETLAKPIKNIIFVGSVPHICKYFAVADVFILTSMSEGLPTVLLEASACGKPIVATNTGGISDIIIHGKTGFLAKPNDVDSFVYYVKLLLNDETLSRKLGENGYEHVRKQFDWNVITKKYESIYEEVVGK